MYVSMETLLRLTDYDNLNQHALVPSAKLRPIPSHTEEACAPAVAKYFNINITLNLDQVYILLLPTQRVYPNRQNV